MYLGGGPGGVVVEVVKQIVVVAFQGVIVVGAVERGGESLYLNYAHAGVPLSPAPFIGPMANFFHAYAITTVGSFWMRLHIQDSEVLWLGRGG